MEPISCKSKFEHTTIQLPS